MIYLWQELRPHLNLRALLIEYRLVFEEGRGLKILVPILILSFGPFAPQDHLVDEIRVLSL